MCAETTEDRRISQLYLMPVWLATRGADAPVDSLVNPSGSSLTVIMNSAEAGGAGTVVHPVGSQLPVRRAVSGAAYAEIRDVGRARR